MVTELAGSSMSSLDKLPTKTSVSMSVRSVMEFDHHTLLTPPVMEEPICHQVHLTLFSVN
jgi:hypothetical protein